LFGNLADSGPVKTGSDHQNLMPVVPRRVYDASGWEFQDIQKNPKKIA
jgi:hypothetical protein